MGKSKFRFGVSLLAAILFCSSVKAQVDTIDITPLKQEIIELKSNQIRLRKDINELTNKNKKTTSRISELESSNKDLYLKLDSIQNAYNKLSENQQADKLELSSSINETKDQVDATKKVMSTRTIWGICGIIGLLIALAISVWTFYRKVKSGSSSIDEVRKAQTSLEEAQETIRKAQSKMQEETIQLDNKLIELLSKQPIPAPTTTASGEIDHSLTLKVADEIVKIEMNLSRMDVNIKGYKQLSRGVQRIKDNFKANNYEIVDMLGKPYQAGMKAAVTFVTDEKLEPGQQIISRIIKPQINYKQVMIQAAEIEVSQAE